MSVIVKYSYKMQFKQATLTTDTSETDNNQSVKNNTQQSTLINALTA